MHLWYLSFHHSFSFTTTSCINALGKKSTLYYNVQLKSKSNNEGKEKEDAKDEKLCRRKIEGKNTASTIE